MGRRSETMDSWASRMWRPIAAFVYLFICVFDFVIMPVYYESTNTKIEKKQAIIDSLLYETSAVQLQVLQTLIEKRTWKPLTLDVAGTFHLAFGAILGAAAWTRGMEKREEYRAMATRNGGMVKSENSDA